MWMMQPVDACCAIIKIGKPFDEGNVQFSLRSPLGNRATWYLFCFWTLKKITNYTLRDTEKRRLCVSHRYWLWIVLSNATNLKNKLMPLLTQYDWYSKQIILLLTHNIHQSAMKNVIMRFDTLIQQPDNFIFFICKIICFCNFFLQECIT